MEDREIQSLSASLEARMFCWGNGTSYFRGYDIIHRSFQGGVCLALKGWKHLKRHIHSLHFFFLFFVSSRNLLASNFMGAALDGKGVGFVL